MGYTIKKKNLKKHFEVDMEAEIADEATRDAFTEFINKQKPSSQ